MAGVEMVVELEELEEEVEATLVFVVRPRRSYVLGRIMQDKLSLRVIGSCHFRCLPIHDKSKPRNTRRGQRLHLPGG